MLDTEVQGFIEDNSTTPDLTGLQFRFESVPVFIYGSEKAGFSDYETMEGCSHVGYAMTASAKYVMYHHERFGLPLVFLEKEPTEITAKVYGDLFMVPVKRLLYLDSLFMNTFHHQRQSRAVRWYPVAQKDKKNKEVFMSWVFMYLADKESWRKDHNQMHRMARVLPKTDPDQKYYLFMKRDDARN